MANDILHLNELDLDTVALLRDVFDRKRKLFNAELKRWKDGDLRADGLYQYLSDFALSTLAKQAAQYNKIHQQISKHIESRKSIIAPQTRRK